MNGRVDMPLRNRRFAGRALADALETRYAGANALVLALPRGGVPVACEVAKRLGAELDIMVVRKLGAPGQPELAAGAIASGGIRVLNQDVIARLGISPSALADVAAREQRELERREHLYRGDRARPQIAGRCVILIDDGAATGATLRAAIAALRQQHPRRVVVAVPVAALETVAALRRDADDVVCLASPAPFSSIGQWYRDFREVSDEEVCRLLGTPNAGAPTIEYLQTGRATPGRAITVDTAGVALEGDLVVPPAATGIIVFAHGSGSSRFSARNRYVAQVLQQGGLATLLFDLLAAEEQEIDEITRELRFDVLLLTRRLTGAIDWLQQAPRTRHLRVGLFGASTGAAAALIAAAARPRVVGAVVSRGGRPDLAMDYLPEVRAPTLLIVGSLDGPVIDLNQQAAAVMKCQHEVHIVPGATHLFAEPGKLETVAELARSWFADRLA
jgi:putative phosphoribosyl transferase